MSTFHSSPIEHHPDLLALRERYEHAAESMTAQSTFGLTFLTALYGALSPWIVGFHGARGLAVNDLIIGLVVAALAFGFGTAMHRTHGMSWTLPILGVWFMISPWMIHGVARTHGMVWSHILAGLLMTFLGLNAAYFGRRAVSAAVRHA